MAAILKGLNNREVDWMALDSYSLQDTYSSSTLSDVIRV